MPWMLQPHNYTQAIRPNLYNVPYRRVGAYKGMGGLGLSPGDPGFVGPVDATTEISQLPVQPAFTVGLTPGGAATYTFPTMPGSTITYAPSVLPTGFQLTPGLVGLLIGAGILVSMMAGRR